jgi:hypothetical protein
MPGQSKSQRVWRFEILAYQIDFELCRRMRAFDADTPILFSTGAAFEADKEEEGLSNERPVSPRLSPLNLRSLIYMCVSAHTNGLALFMLAILAIYCDRKPGSLGFR